MRKLKLCRPGIILLTHSDDLTAKESISQFRGIIVGELGIMIPNQSEASNALINKMLKQRFNGLG